MPLDPRMLNSIVRISSAGDLLGTGSIVGVESEAYPGLHWPYVVTAHHVIRNQVEIQLEAPDPLTHTQLLTPVESESWRQPFDGIDLAISPFPASRVPRYQGTHLGIFVPKGHVPPLGGAIHYLGMFAPLNIPMARSGTLGALDAVIDKSADGYVYRADLVDCRSYGGFSGSPCFSTMTYAILDEGFEAPEGAPLKADGSPLRVARVISESRLCGMLTAHYSDEARANGAVSHYGVCLMLSSDTIREALMTEEARAERRQWDSEREAVKAAEQPPFENLGARPSSSKDWDRFEELTRKLVQEPKSKTGSK